MGKVIEKLKPRIIVFGYDQDGVEESVRRYVKERKLPIKIVKIEKFKENELNSSSKIRQKVIEHLKR